MGKNGFDLNEISADINNDINELNKFSNKKFSKVFLSGIKLLDIAIIMLFLLVIASAFKGYDTQKALFASIGWIVAVIAYIALNGITAVSTHFHGINMRYNIIVKKSVAFTNTLIKTLNATTESNIEKTNEDTKILH